MKRPVFLLSLITMINDMDTKDVKWDLKSLTFLLIFVLFFVGKVDAKPKNEKIIILPQQYQILSSELFKYDNAYLIVNRLFSEDGPDSFSKIINVNAYGKILWERILGKKAPDNWISKVLYIPTKKRFALLGTVNYKFYRGGIGSGWIVMVDENSKILWDKEIKRGRVTHINDGLITDNGSIIAVGNVYEGKDDESFKNSFLLNVNTDGKIFLSKEYTKRINFIRKLSENEFLIGNFGSFESIDSWLGIIDSSGYLKRFTDINPSLDSKDIEFVLIDKTLFIISISQREQVSIIIFDTDQLAKPVKIETFFIKDLCSLFDVKVFNNKTIVFSGKSCHDKLNAKVIKLSFVYLNKSIKLETLKDINFKTIVKNGELLNADYKCSIAVGTLDEYKIWLYLKFSKNIE